MSKSKAIENEVRWNDNAGNDAEQSERSSMCLTHNLCICTALHEIKRKMFHRYCFAVVAIDISCMRTHKQQQQQRKCNTESEKTKRERLRAREKKREKNPLERY